MSDIKLISFTRLDSLPSHIEHVVKDIADFFTIMRPYVSEYCSLIKISKRWNTSNLSEKLRGWKEMMSRRPKSTPMTDLVERAFNSCTCQEDIDSLRGAMVEALVIGGFGGSQHLRKNNYGWGARVDINKEGEPLQKVTYKCLAPKGPECFRRSTVDFGYWNGKHGKFYECKVQPDKIGCKEMRYMEHLKSELEKNKVSHEIFFVCADYYDEIRIQLDTYGLSPVYKAVGIRELERMMVAS